MTTLKLDELQALLADAQPIRDVVLAEADLSGVDLSGGLFERVDFRACRLRGANLSGNIFVACQFDGVDAVESNWHCSSLSDCSL